MLEQTLVVRFGRDKSELGGLREHVACSGVDESLLFFSIEASSSFLIPETRTRKGILVVGTLLQGQRTSVNRDSTGRVCRVGRVRTCTSGTRNRVSEQTAIYSIDGIAQTSVANDLVGETHSGKSFSRDETVTTLVATISRRAVKGNRSEIFDSRSGGISTLIGCGVAILTCIIRSGVGSRRHGHSVFILSSCSISKCVFVRT